MEYLPSYLYILATIAFVLGIKRLSGVRTARSGNQIASLGMLIAIVAVLVATGHLNWWLAVSGLLIGTAIGVWLARTVEMTAMPELVAAFNGLGGAASAFVGLAYVLAHQPEALADGSAGTLLDRADVTVASAVTLPISILIGMATLTGSFVAYLKLGGKKLAHPLGGALRHSAHAALALLLLAVSFWQVSFAEAGWSLAVASILLVLLASLLGVLLVLPIGGADMPVVIALLNSYSGLAACATGFVISNNVLSSRVRWSGLPA
jgi:NAD(P) transhydrogenase subunit beta